MRVSNNYRTYLREVSKLIENNELNRDELFGLYLPSILEQDIITIKKSRILFEHSERLLLFSIKNNLEKNIDLVIKESKMPYNTILYILTENNKINYIDKYFKEFSETDFQIVLEQMPITVNLEEYIRFIISKGVFMDYISVINTLCKNMINPNFYENLFVRINSLYSNNVINSKELIQLINNSPFISTSIVYVLKKLNILSYEEFMFKLDEKVSFIDKIGIIFLEEDWLLKLIESPIDKSVYTVGGAKFSLKSMVRIEILSNKKIMKELIKNEKIKEFLK